MTQKMFPFSFDDKSIKILAVDDMLLSRNTAKRLMAELGFKNIELAENGEAAFALLEKAQAEGNPYKLVLTDWMMPLMDGLALLGKIKNSNWKELPPVVMLTAEADAKQVSIALREGALGYVKKPIEIDALKTTLVSLSERLAG
jgi:CheY-like chemotaxis protein